MTLLLLTIAITSLLLGIGLAWGPVLSDGALRVLSHAAALSLVASTAVGLSKLQDFVLTAPKTPVASCTQQLHEQQKPLGIQESVPTFSNPKAVLP
jgi:hypothetical protein